MFVAFKRKLSCAYVKLHKMATREIGAQFFENLTEKVPFTIHIVLTDNRTQLLIHEILMYKRK